MLRNKYIIPVGIVKTMHISFFLIGLLLIQFTYCKKVNALSLLKTLVNNICGFETYWKDEQTEKAMEIIAQYPNPEGINA